MCARPPIHTGVVDRGSSVAGPPWTSAKHPPMTGSIQTVGTVIITANGTHSMNSTRRCQTSRDRGPGSSGVTEQTRRRTVRRVVLRRHIHSAKVERRARVSYPRRLLRRYVEKIKGRTCRPNTGVCFPKSIVNRSGHVSTEQRRCAICPAKRCTPFR